MGKSIGIDLGTTNSVVCIMHTEPELILNRENKRLTPSAVAFRQSKKTGDVIMVGTTAEQAAKNAGANYLYSVKRLMGLAFDDPEVQLVKQRVTYRIEPSPDGSADDVRVRLGDQLYQPTEISAMILKKIKEDAEMRLGDKVDSAVITVPAYFSERQKNATREAGVLAGLKVKKLIDEPTAAAIAYGIDQQDDQDRMVLVFDLGGGTFDVSILLMVGGIFSQMDNEGDMWLGGDDFDRVIMDQVLQEIEKEYGVKNADQNTAFGYELRKGCRQAKEILSSQNSAEIIVQGELKDEDGLPVDVECEVTREEFETALKPFVERAMNCVRQAIKEANLDQEDIDAVLLVGGSSTVPKFQEALEEYFGPEKIMRGVDPMICVAQGAAILAKSLSGVFCPSCEHENPLDAEKCEKCEADLGAAKAAEVQAPHVEHISRTPKPYGIEVEGDHFQEIIPKNEIYPTEDPFIRDFKTTMHGQQIIKVPLREGHESGSTKAQDCTLMGTIWFYGLPPGLPVGTPIDLSMALDENMNFSLECRVRGTDWFRRSTLVREQWKNNVLDEAMQAHIDLQREGVSGEEAQKLLDEIDQVQKAVESDNSDQAKSHVEKLKDLKQKAQDRRAQAQPALADWKNTCQNIIALGENTLQRVKFVLPQGNPQVQAFEDWLRNAKDAMNSGDEIRGKLLAEEGLNKLIAVPLVGDLVVAAILVGHPSVPQALGQRLDKARNEVFSCLDRRDVAAIKNSVEAFRTILQEALKEIEQTGAPADIKVLLGR